MAKKTTNVEASAAEPEKAVEPVMEKSEHIRVKETVDPNAIVTVRNGFNGTLVYKSKRTGETWIWEHFGDEQDLEVSELKNAKNSSKAFFERGWFLIDDPDVIEYLGVRRYYDSALTMDDFDNLGGMTADQITTRLNKLSDVQKKTAAARIRTMIQDGEIDSIKVITAIEKCLGVTLIER